MGRALGSLIAVSLCALIRSLVRIVLNHRGAHSVPDPLGSRTFSWEAHRLRPLSWGMSADAVPPEPGKMTTGEPRVPWAPRVPGARGLRAVHRPAICWDLPCSEAADMGPVLLSKGGMGPAPGSAALE
jgi:hypothetical protein